MSPRRKDRYLLSYVDLLDHDELPGEDLDGKDDVRNEDSKNNQGQSRLDNDFDEEGYDCDDYYVNGDDDDNMVVMTFICT